MLKGGKEKKKFFLFIKERKSFFMSRGFIKLLFPLSIAIILIVIFINGCSSAKKPIQLMMLYQAVEHLNPDIEGNAAPLVVVVYQLKSPTKFQEAEFFSLYTDPATVLGKNLLDKQEAEIQPGQSLTDVQNLSSEATYLGIIAGYRDIANATWKTTAKVSEIKKKTIEIILGMSGIDLYLDKKSKDNKKK